VSLDLSSVTEGPQQFAIDESHIKLPSNLALFRSIPRVVSLNVHTWIRGRVDVTPQTEGRLPRDLRQREVRVVPDQLQVMIWQSLKSSATRIYTEPVELGRLTDASELKVKLIVPQHMRLESDQPSEVSIKLDAVSDPTDAASVP
jgi:YbbR domain-containing protein